MVYLPNFRFHHILNLWTWSCSKRNVLNVKSLDGGFFMSFSNWKTTQDNTTSYSKIYLRAADGMFRILKSRVKHSGDVIHTRHTEINLILFIYTCSFLFTVLANPCRKPSGKPQGCNEFVNDARRWSEIYILSMDLCAAGGIHHLKKKKKER